MVLAISGGSQAILFIIVRVPRNSLVGVNLLNMLHGSLHRPRVLRGLYTMT